MRRQLLSGGLSLGLLCALSLSSHAQYSFSSRALAMGGAFTAIAEGDGGVTWNPAALASQKGGRFALPSLSLLDSGAANLTNLLSGVSNNWNDRFAQIRKWVSGPTDLTASAFTGYSAPGFGISFAAMGNGVVMPYDANGVAGHTPLSPTFTLAALNNAGIKAFEDAGFAPASAASETNKIIANIQKTYPGATSVAVPVYNSKLVGQGNVYGAGLMTFARQVKRRLRIGINLKLVAADRITGTANFNQETFNQMAARVTGGTASPALVDRVLMNLNLRNTDGSYFSGDQLAGNYLLTTVHSGLEIRPSADLGTLWQVTDRFQTGLVVRNLIPAHFQSVTPLNTYFDLGTAYILKPKSLLMAVDLTNLLDSQATHLNMGIEWRTPAHITLRAGLYRGNPTYGFGLGNLVNVAMGANMSVVSFGLGF